MDLAVSARGPLLVLWGDKDPFVPADGPTGKLFRDLKSLRKDTSFEMLKGAFAHGTCAL